MINTVIRYKFEICNDELNDELPKKKQGCNDNYDSFKNLCEIQLQTNASNDRYQFATLGNQINAFYNREEKQRRWLNFKTLRSN